jgi:uncharacterized protein YndB with AHSA1/START domain
MSDSFCHQSPVRCEKELPEVTMHRQGRKQLERHATVNAPVGVVYRLFMDNAELANWAPAVDAVTGHGGDDTGLGATRTCAVTMNGKKGTMLERCAEAVPDTRASFLVVYDSFGFSKMLTGYGFTAHFTPTASEQTTVRIETFYTPAGPAAALLNRLIMRRKFRSVVDELLGGLCTLAEQRHTQYENLSTPR